MTSTETPDTLRRVAWLRAQLHASGDRPFVVQDSRRAAYDLEAVLAENTALRAEREEALDRVDDLEKDAEIVSTDFEKDCWIAVRALLEKVGHTDFSDGVTAQDATDILWEAIRERDRKADRALAQLAETRERLERADRDRDRRADETLEVVAALYKAWPDAEDIASDWPLGIIGSIEQIIAERDDALASLAVVRESLIEQAAARADPTMPLLLPEVLEAIRGDAEASYACAETSEERIAAHGLSLLCDWQDRARAYFTPDPVQKEDLGSSRAEGES